MSQQNPEVDAYFISGCGRCDLFDTPKCKVHRWTAELALLRSIALSTGLTEVRKWGVPCYTLDDKNVMLIGAFNDNCTLSFLKGALIPDPYGLLQKPGENSHEGRVLRFTDVAQIMEQEANIQYYISAAIEIEKKGLKVPKPQTTAPIPQELSDIMDAQPDLKKAFYALTPGKQRGYILHFSQPKQAQTRISRIEKYIPKILMGKGFHD